ncbi:hypothetical protein BGX28_001637 [Mortierella sp. GBA30]|nr:hypothetical protein BGX28_001637 [Mortierella sp. GBA30]
MDLDTALYIYMNGLEPETSKEVRLRQPETMAQAVHQASIVHGILHPNGPTSVSAPSLPATQPMDLDAVSVLISHLASLTGANVKVKPSPSLTTNVAYLRRPLGKLTPAERERLRKIGACFRCRRKGHLAADCHATSFNNLEAENDDDESGKDLGEA